MSTKNDVRTILIRVDGSPTIGLGHVMRGLVLAEGLHDRNPNLQIYFLTKNEVSKNIILKKGYNVIENSENNWKDQIKRFNVENTLFITDFLDTDNSFLSKIKSLGFRVLSIDNNTQLKKLNADIVVNANVFEEQDFTDENTAYYLGPRYMILKKEYNRMGSNEKKRASKVKLILVIFGGSDQHFFTLKVAKALSDLDSSVAINLVVGPAFLHVEKLNQFLLETKRAFNVFHSPENLPEIMASADIAITAGGITLYELAALGIPAIVIPQAPHELEIARMFSKYNACINLGMTPTFTPIREKSEMLVMNKSFRNKLSNCAKKLVDGQGLERVISLIL